MRRRMTARDARPPFAAAFTVSAVLTGAAADGGAPYDLTLLLGGAAAALGLALAATFEKDDDE